MKKIEFLEEKIQYLETQNGKLSTDKTILKNQIVSLNQNLAEANLSLHTINEYQKSIFQILNLSEFPNSIDSWKHAQQAVEKIVSLDQQFKNDYENLKIKKHGKEVVADEKRIKGLQFAINSRESDLITANARIELLKTRIQFAKPVDKQNNEISKNLSKLYFILDTQALTLLKSLILVIIFTNRFRLFVKTPLSKIPFDIYSLSIFSSSDLVFKRK